MRKFGIRRYTKRARQKPAINMTPLIDTVLFLLFFFMVATALKEKEMGFEVDKPKAGTGDVLAVDHMIIGVTADGRFFYEEQEVALATIRERVAQRILEKPNTNIVVLADKGSLTQSVVDLLDECKAAGAENLSLATKMEAPEAAAP